MVPHKLGGPVSLHGVLLLQNVLVLHIGEARLGVDFDDPVVEHVSVFESGVSSAVARTARVTLLVAATTTHLYLLADY